MTDKTKYKSVAIDNDCYKKIEELTTALIPGITISRAQVVRFLVDQKVFQICKSNNCWFILRAYTSTKSRVLKDIDDKMLILLGLEQKELPWLNCNDLMGKYYGRPKTSCKIKIRSSRCFK